MRSRGYSLIELMVTIAILGIGGVTLLFEMGTMQRLGDRAVEVEGLARVLDSELERLHACPDRACILATRTAAPSEEADTWLRAEITRSVKPGPDGTLRVSVEVQSPHYRGTYRADTLLWRPR